ncbi:MAG TPA: hypothetical protein VMZ92_08750 [Planctomycetota bacterium]|nr:hypothetical protein [Planctomycetota bacterium]
MRPAALVLSVFCTLAGCDGVASEPRSAQPVAFPVRWTHHVELKDLAEARALDKYLDAPVVTVNGREKINMVEINGEGKTVATTPREWLELRGKRYAPRTTYDIKAESWFKSVVVPKLCLACARPARVSHLRDFRLTDRPLQQLPLHLGLNLMEQSTWEERLARFERGETWGEICPTLRVEVEDEYAVVVADDDEKNCIELLAWADFDGDGIEDVLLSVTNYAIRGTFCAYRYVIVTRKTRGGRLLVIRRYS